MRISYRVCDICGQKLTDGCVIDVRFRTVKDGKNAQAQRCIDMCDGCFNEIKNRLDAVDDMASKCLVSPRRIAQAFSRAYVRASKRMVVPCS